VVSVEKEINMPEQTEKETTATAEPTATQPGTGKKDKAAKEAADARYTDADLADRLKAERAKWEADAKARADADKAKADEASAREQGKWKELADKATAERDAARTEAARVRAENALHRHLAEKHPDYVGAAKWILPAVEFDATTTPETLAKRIEEAAAAYAKDNPRGPKPGAGAPPSPTGGRTAGGKKDNKANGEKPQFTGAARGF
jgi:hypothetical protein